MILMSIDIDKILGFENFNLDFSYPKKTKEIIIPYEFLEERPNFRFKRINTIMGANASGKTSLGRVMRGIFNFLNTGIKEFMLSLINDKDEKSEFKVDFATKNNELLRISFVFHRNEIIDFSIRKSKINKSDNYEKCIKKLKLISKKKNDLDHTKALKELKMNKLEFGFSLLDNIQKNYKIDRKILDIILKTLDSSVKKVVKSKDAEETFLIEFKNTKDEMIIQRGKILNKSRLSSGTIEGVSIAKSLSAIKNFEKGIYYIDENFSYIQSNVEIAIYNLMIEMLSKRSQLFFTTHNTDLLDMKLPIHSYLFLKKTDKIDKIYSETLINKEYDSLKSLVENEIFGTVPSTYLLDNYVI